MTDSGVRAESGIRRSLQNNIVDILIVGIFIVDETNQGEILFTGRFSGGDGSIYDPGK